MGRAQATSNGAGHSKDAAMQLTTVFSSWLLRYILKYTDGSIIDPRHVMFTYQPIPSSVSQVKVSCYFIELYLDNLRDLLFAMHHPRDNPPKLEVHLDANKMVVVKNVVIKVSDTVL